MKRRKDEKKKIQSGGKNRIKKLLKGKRKREIRKNYKEDVERKIKE